MALANAFPWLATASVGSRSCRSGALTCGDRTGEADVLRQLPIQARVSRLWLMTGNNAPGSWHAVAELPLAAG